MTTPPKHPLPPRPDWAAGMKAQPTLHPPVRHRHDSNNSRTMSPARPPNQQLHGAQQPVLQQRPPIHVQPNDFPPLSSVSGQANDRRPSAGGVWSNTNLAARSILSANPTHSNQPQVNTYGSALFNHSGGNRLEDDERGFERPPRKGSAELFNPKAVPKRANQSQPIQHTFSRAGEEGSFERMEQKNEKEGARDEVVMGLADKAGTMRIRSPPREVEIANTPKAGSILTGLPQEVKIGDGRTSAGTSDSVVDG